MPKRKLSFAPSSKWKRKCSVPRIPDLEHAQQSGRGAGQGGKYAEAETEDRNVLKLDEKVLGPEHPDSLDTRSNLALALLHQGKYS